MPLRLVTTTSKPWQTKFTARLLRLRWKFSSALKSGGSWHAVLLTKLPLNTHTNKLPSQFKNCPAMCRGFYLSNRARAAVADRDDVLPVWHSNLYQPPTPLIRCPPRRYIRHIHRGRPAVARSE